MGPGGKVSIKSYDDDEHQADQIIDMVQQEGEWAVLARTNIHLDYIEGRLQTYKIQVKRLGGKSFWEPPDADSFLKLLYSLRNPYSIRFLGEERRLLYVGMTRAEQSLCMTYYGDASYFLREAFPEAAA